MTPVIIWTRSRDDWSEDKPLLEAAAGQVPILHLPAVSIHRLPVVLPNPKKPYIAIVTSVQSLRCAEKDTSFLALLRAAERIYTHGSETTRYGLSIDLPMQHLSQCKTAADLPTHLSGLVAKSCEVILPRARDVAFDLSSVLTNLGYRCYDLICYETEAKITQGDGSPISDALAQTLSLNLHGVICFFSPSSVASFTTKFHPNSNQLHTRLKALAIGPTTAQAATLHFERVITAPESTRSAMLMMLPDLFR